MAGTPAAFDSSFQQDAFQTGERIPPVPPTPIAVLPSMQPFPQLAGIGPGPGPASGPPSGKRTKLEGAYKPFRPMGQPSLSSKGRAKFKKPRGYTKH